MKKFIAFFGLMSLACAAFAAPKKVVVVLASGFEEVEAAAPIDIMRRAGLDVTVAGLDGTQVKGANGLTYVADARYADVNIMEYDGIVLPGGMPGAENLAASQKVISDVRIAAKNSKVVAAICASPALVLAKAGVLDGHHATCYPHTDFTSRLSDKVIYEKADTVTDRNIITVSGPGTAMLFALAIVSKMVDEKTADGLRDGMLVQ